jgi:transposase
MTIEFDSNRILSKKEREERVLDLYFNQNKNYRQIAQVMKMSVRDIGEIVNRAKQEKERQEPKSLSVQAYEHFSTITSISYTKYWTGSGNTILYTVFEPSSA